MGEKLKEDILKRIKEDTYHIKSFKEENNVVCVDFNLEKIHYCLYIDLDIYLSGNERDFEQMEEPMFCIKEYINDNGIFLPSGAKAYKEDHKVVIEIIYHQFNFDKSITDISKSAYLTLDTTTGEVNIETGDLFRGMVDVFISSLLITESSFWVFIRYLILDEYEAQGINMSNRYDSFYHEFNNSRLVMVHKKDIVKEISIIAYSGFFECINFFVSKSYNTGKTVDFIHCENFYQKLQERCIESFNYHSQSPSKMLAAKGIPNKRAFRKLIYTDLDLIGTIKNFCDLGFSENQICDLILRCGFNDVNKNSIILNKYLKECGVKSTFKKINQIDVMTQINDAERMLKTILKEKVITLDDLSFKQNIHNLEQEIIKYHSIYEEMKYKKECKEQFNYDIPGIAEVAGETYALLGSSGEYEFILPTRPAFVRKVGRQNGLCISSYIKKIKENECFIVLIQKNKKIEGCLEMNEAFERCVQAKACFNKKLKGDLLSATYDFLNQQEIEINTKDLEKLEEDMG